MSIQWTLVASLLYIEIAVVLLLVFPIASPLKWQKIFKSRFLQAFSNQSRWYFAFAIFILLLFFLDSIRDIRKYSNEDLNNAHLQRIETEMQHHMKLFRAQRNFYISGFALFLALVIRKLIKLISTQATLMAEYEAALSQAKSATSAARNFMAQSSGAGEAAQNSYNEAHQKEITKLKEELQEAKKELEKVNTDKEAILSQAKSVEKEYDRLNEEHRKLLLQVEGSSNKKEE